MLALELAVRFLPHTTPPGATLIGMDNVLIAGPLSGTKSDERGPPRGWGRRDGLRVGHFQWIASITSTIKRVPLPGPVRLTICDQLLLAVNVTVLPSSGKESIFY